MREVSAISADAAVFEGSALLAVDYCCGYGLGVDVNDRAIVLYVVGWITRKEEADRCCGVLGEGQVGHASGTEEQELESADHCFLFLEIRGVSRMLSRKRNFNFFAEMKCYVNWCEKKAASCLKYSMTVTQSC